MDKDDSVCYSNQTSSFALEGRAVLTAALGPRNELERTPDFKLSALFEALLSNAPETAIATGD